MQHLSARNGKETETHRVDVRVGQCLMLLVALVEECAEFLCKLGGLKDVQPVALHME